MINKHIDTVIKEERELMEILYNKELPKGFRYSSSTSLTQFRCCSIRIPIIVNDETKEVKVISFNKFLNINYLPFGLEARHKYDIGLGRYIKCYADIIRIENDNSV